MAFSGFGNKAPTSTTGGFSFGSSSSSKPAATGFSFGGNTASKPAVGVVAPTQPATTSAGLGFGLSNQPTTNTLGGFSFGKTTVAATTTTNTGFGLNFGGTTATSNPLNLSSTATSKATFTGLGGSDLSSTANSADNGSKTTSVGQAVKDQTVPDEIVKYVTAFEEHTKKQKECSSEVGKFSVHSLNKIKGEIHSIASAINNITAAVERNKVAVERLRVDFNEQLRNSEMVQRTQDTPSALQHDNVAPIQYFINLVTGFSASMQACKKQVEELENHFHNIVQPSSIDPQDISTALCKMQDSFINLASNLHSIHQNIKQLKENYLAYRRVVLGDNTDIFSSSKENEAQRTPPKQTGPAPFNNISKVAALAMASMVNPLPQNPPPPQQTFLKTGFGGSTGTSNIFGNAGNTSLFGSTLNKPSTGLFGTSKPATTTTSSFGFGSSTNTLKPALSAGYNKSTSGNTFFGNSTFNSSAGVTFGGSALKPFDLKTPLKRNKK